MNKSNGEAEGIRASPLAPPCTKNGEAVNKSGVRQDEDAKSLRRHTSDAASSSRNWRWRCVVCCGPVHVVQRVQQSCGEETSGNADLLHFGTDLSCRHTWMHVSKLWVLPSSKVQILYTVQQQVVRKVTTLL